MFPNSQTRPSASVRQRTWNAAFNEIMAKTAGLSGVIVPIGDGLWVAVRD